MNKNERYESSRNWKRIQPGDISLSRETAQAFQDAAVGWAYSGDMARSKECLMMASKGDAIADIKEGLSLAMQQQENNLKSVIDDLKAEIAHLKRE